MKTLLFILLGCISLNAYAHNCPGEFQPESGSCRIIGPDGRQIIYNSDPPQSAGPTPRKIIRHIEVNVPSKYGALALNKKTGGFGGAIEMNSKAEAKREAIKRCENGGRNAPCKVISWVRNGCIAAAANSKNVLFTAAEEPGHAENVVMDKCRAAGKSGCKIVLPEACSIPDTSQY